MIRRELAGELEKMAGWFPVVTLTGPRQSGKSTLVRAVFSDYEYVNLEDVEVRRAALDDPVGFIRRRPPRLIIDEAQYAPELFSMIQAASDEHGETGQYVLSGSQNFLLLKSIQQSLAGRAGILTLMPLSYREASAVSSGLTEYVLTGGYPRIYDAGMPRDVFFRNYIATYVERDVGELMNVRNLAAFRSMLALLAAQAGQLVNHSRIASDLGVATATVKSWLSVLQAGHIIFELRPLHTSARKRLTKSPKLYFHDTGLLCHLLRISTPEQLRDSPMRGTVIENFAVAERLRLHLNRGEEPELYFYRDDSKREIDLIDLTDEPLAVEVKSGETYRGSFARHLDAVCPDIAVAKGRRVVAYMGSERYRSEGVEVVPLGDLDGLL